MDQPLSLHSSKGGDVVQPVPHTAPMTVDTSLKAESLLLEELQHQRDSMSQLTSEISSTFNFYLVAFGIIAVGIGTIETVYYQLYNTTYVHTLTNITDILTVAVLVLGYLLSFVFLLRFLQLAEREYRTIIARNKIQEFYVSCLKSQMPTIEAVFLQQNDTEYYSYVPSYIRHTISLVGSLSFSGAVWIALSYISVNQTLDTFLSGLILIISVCLLQLYCHRYKAQFIKKLSSPR